MKAKAARTSLAALALGAAALTAGCDDTPTDVESVQRGFRGTGMVELENTETLAGKLALNQVPEPEPPAEPGGEPATAVYQNVQVLNDLTVDQFNRVMLAITEWVSPEEGCTYCHNPENLAEDSVYTKHVARRMLQMTRHINQDWQSHVRDTGVTCYTCHRGQHVPSNLWFTDPGRRHAQGVAGNPAGQNIAAPTVGLASLPSDPFTPYFAQAQEIRIESATDLPAGNRSSIKQAEWTYGLMMHFAGSLGVNCTYCHNTRQFAAWDQSSLARTNAWYGIRMVRNANVEYLDPLQPVYPPHRLGPLGDAGKINCATCHQGAYKPLYGISMLKDYPELAKAGEPLVVPAAAVTPAPAPAAAEPSQPAPAVVVVPVQPAPETAPAPAAPPASVVITPAPVVVVPAAPPSVVITPAPAPAATPPAQAAPPAQ